MANKILKIEESENLAKEINYGVHTTFSSMFGMKPEPQPIRREETCGIQSDVTGILSLVQDRNEGTFIVSFPKATIFAMLSKMYRREFTEVDQSVRLGVGELTNIIYGVLKANLNKDGYHFKMAIPNVILGENHTVSSSVAGPVLIMPYATPVGGFTVVMAFHGEAAGAEAA